jgi:ribosome-binding protein aMBF1 (putative translation factor)
MSSLREVSKALHGGIDRPAEANRLDTRQVAVAFAQVLRMARRERGFSQERLAECAHLDRTYPSLLERGLRHPTLAMLPRLSRALAVEPAELVNGTVRHLRERGVRL